MDSRYFSREKTERYNIAIELLNQTYYVCKADLPLVAIRYMRDNKIVGFTVVGVTTKVVNITADVAVKLLSQFKNVMSTQELAQSTSIATQILPSQNQPKQVHIPQSSKSAQPSQPQQPSQPVGIRSKRSFEYEQGVKTSFEYAGKLPANYFGVIEEQCDIINSTANSNSKVELIISNREVIDKVEYITFVLRGSLVVSDWVVIAHLEFTSKGVLVLPFVNVDKDILKSWYTIKPYCDHCGYNRNRNHTYMVMNKKTKEIHQVGQGCLNEYIGVGALAQATAFDTLLKLLQDNSELLREKQAQYFFVDDVLACIIDGNYPIGFYIGYYDDMKDEVQQQVADIKAWARRMRSQGVETHNTQVMLKNEYLKKNQAERLPSVVNAYNKYLEIQKIKDETMKVIPLQMKALETYRNGTASREQGYRDFIAEYTIKQTDKIKAEFEETKRKNEMYAKKNIEIEAYNKQVNARNAKIDKYIERYNNSKSEEKQQVLLKAQQELGLVMVPEYKVNQHIVFKITGVKLLNRAPSPFGGNYGTFIFITNKGVQIAWRTQIEKFSPYFECRVGDDFIDVITSCVIEADVISIDTKTNLVTVKMGRFVRDKEQQAKMLAQQDKEDGVRAFTLRDLIAKKMRTKALFVLSDITDSETGITALYTKKIDDFIATIHSFDRILVSLSDAFVVSNAANITKRISDTKESLRGMKKEQKPAETKTIKLQSVQYYVPKTGDAILLFKDTKQNMYQMRYKKRLTELKDSWYDEPNFDVQVDAFAFMEYCQGVVVDMRGYEMECTSTAFYTRKKRDGTISHLDTIWDTAKIRKIK